MINPTRDENTSNNGSSESDATGNNDSDDDDDDDDDDELKYAPSPGEIKEQTFDLNRLLPSRRGRTINRYKQ